jgi:peptidyl-prolyl cis-trans isomerase B (cyclophilin B)
MPGCPEWAMIARMAYPQPPPGNQWSNQPPGSTPGFYPPMYPPPRQTNAMAIGALVSAFFFPPLGIVLGHIALSHIRRSGEEGHGMAVAGLVIGYVHTALWLLVIVAYVIFFAWFATEIDKMPSTRTTFGTYSMQDMTDTGGSIPPAQVLSLVTD